MLVAQSLVPLEIAWNLNAKVRSDASSEICEITDPKRIRSVRRRAAVGETLRRVGDRDMKAGAASAEAAADELYREMLNDLEPDRYGFGWWHGYLDVP